MEAVFIGILCVVVGYLAGYVITNKKLTTQIKAKETELVDKDKLFTLAQLEATGLKSTLQDREKTIERLQEIERNYHEKEKQLAAAETETASIDKLLISKCEELSRASEELSKSKQQVAALEATHEQLVKTRNEINETYEGRIKDAEEKIHQLTNDREKLAKELAAIKEQEPIRAAEFERRTQTLNQAMVNLEKEREKDKLEKLQADEARLQKLRDTWVDHEMNVEEKIKIIAQEQQITYIDKEKFPFKGKPDNTLLICDEHVIFDAKSPEGDDLSNFPNYIRSEAEKMAKYLNQEGVKKDGFLVVPTSAIHVIKETYINLGGCRVHVIPVEAILPVVIHLKKIEDYEFAETMSPENRDKIVAYVGRVAHLLKRRAQVDYFFINETISALMAGENLPDDILEAAQKVEKASKLNPPVERRTKKVDTAESIKKESEKLHGRLEGQEIHVGPELKTAIQVVPLQKVTES